MDCIICLGQLQNPETVPCCLKTYCGQCLSNWILIRNCCPTCIKPIGNNNLNVLVNHGSQQFDNGCLMLQNQLATVIQRVEYLQTLIQAKRTQSKNHKNSFPASHLSYAQHEMQRIYENVDIASLSVSENDRSTASTSIQVITELIYNVQGILSGQSIIDHYSCSSDDDYEDDYDEQQLMRGIKQSGSKRNQARVSKRKM